jgi:hypothetical protein
MVWHPCGVIFGLRVTPNETHIESLATALGVLGVLRDFAVGDGAPSGIELIQSREKDKTILMGLPGTMAMIEQGEFPPPPPLSYIPSTTTTTNTKE